MRNKNRFTTSIKHEGYGKSQESPLSVIIPVAGMAHRMKSYGPKCLLPVNRKYSILDKIILNIQSTFPFSEINAFLCPLLDHVLTSFRYVSNSSTALF